MIAQHAVHAVLSLQLAQCAQVFGYLLRIHVLQVARKHNHVGLLCIDRVNRPLQQPLVAPRVAAHVRIRKEHYLVAVESLRQLGRCVCLMVHLQLLEADKRAV